MSQFAPSSGNAAESDELAPRCGPRVLVCVDWFDPGTRAGGPIRSCVNLIELLCDQIAFSVLTGDRDLGAETSYSNVEIGVWTTWNGKAKIRYATKWELYTGAFLDAVRRHQPDVIYLNSMFSFSGTIIPLMTQILRQKTRIVLAPRGMLKVSALSIRSGRKSSWLWFLRWSGLASRITFHATSADEAEEIRSVFGQKSKIFVVSNVPRRPSATLTAREKHPGTLKLCLVGRVHPIKNILFAIRLLKGVAFSCSLKIIGPIEDESYYAECQNEISGLTENITVTFVGAVSNDSSIQHIRESHAMLLPTLGENFGHAIFESLSIGIPVIISDMTVWRGLQADFAGWDLPLGEPEKFRAAIEQLALMDSSQYQLWQQGAHETACRFFDQNDWRKSYLEMFSARSID